RTNSASASGAMPAAILKASLFSRVSCPADRVTTAASTENPLLIAERRETYAGGRALIMASDFFLHDPASSSLIPSRCAAASSRPLYELETGGVVDSVRPSRASCRRCKQIVLHCHFARLVGAPTRHELASR